MGQIDKIETRIFTIRGLQVMLDRDLAELYQVPVKAFNQAVKRNINRFPSDFHFQITKSEFKTLVLRSQIVTSNSSWWGYRTQSDSVTQELANHADPRITARYYR